MNPALATGWYLWRRIRITVTGLLAAMAVLAGMVRLPTNPVMENLVRSGTFFTAMGLLSLIVAFTYQESSGTRTDPALGGSNFPISMLVLPVRTRNLVLWPVVYASIVLLGLWALFAGFVLRPQGVPVDLIWPGLALLAFTTSTQASTWAKFQVPVANLICALGGFFLVSVLSVASGTQAISAPAAYAGFLAFIAATVGVSLWGLARARVGQEYWRTGGRSDSAAPVKQGAPFASGFSAQLWMELRRSGPFLPGFVLGGCLVLGVVTAIEGAGGAVTLLGTAIESTDRRFAFLACLPLAIMFASATGSSPRKQDTFTPALSLQPFFACRPLSTASLAGGKLLSSFVSSLGAAVILAISIGLWLLLPAQVQGHSTTMAAAIGSVLGRRWPAWTVASFVLLVLAIWKSSAAFSCFEATGRKWLGVVISLFFGGCVAGAPILWLRVQTEPEVLREWARYLPETFWALFGVKVGLAALGFWMLRRGEKDGVRFGVWVLLGWALGVSVCTAAVGSLLAVDRLWTLGGVAMFLPLNRVLWTPVALGWNRHR